MKREDLAYFLADEVETRLYEAPYSCFEEENPRRKEQAEQAQEFWLRLADDVIKEFKRKKTK